MRPAVHPDGAVDEVLKVRVQRNGFTGDWIDVLRDPHGVDAAPHVGGAMGTALPFHEAVAGRVPAIRTQPGGVVQRQAGEVAELAAWHALHLILVIALRPLAREIDLGIERDADERGRHDEREAEESSGTHVALREELSVSDGARGYWNVPVSYT